MLLSEAEFPLFTVVMRCGGNEAGALPCVYGHKKEGGREGDVPRSQGVLQALGRDRCLCSGVWVKKILQRGR